MIFGVDGALFNAYADAAVAGNAQAMMALSQLSGIPPGSGATVADVIRAGMDALRPRQRTEIATLLVSTFIASTPGDHSIDGAKFAAVVASATARPRLDDGDGF